MTKQINHINEPMTLNPETEGLMSNTSIDWSKSKETIWSELEEKMEEKKIEISSSNLSIFSWQKLAVAASLLILIGISGVMYFYAKTIDNALARQMEFLLPDNSKVTLYAHSSLSYKPYLWIFSRTVRFEGEAMFQVQKGKKFEVVSENGRTIVLGTEFIVFSRGRNYDVTCISGKVKVVELAHLNNAVITAGQKAVLKPDGHFTVELCILNKEQEKNKKNDQLLEDELNTVLSVPAIEAKTVVNKNEPSTSEIKGEIKSPAGTTETNSEQTNTDPNPNEQNRLENREWNEQQNNSQQTSVEKTKADVNGQSASQKHEDQSNQGEGKGKSGDKFRDSLTPDQIRILENKQMSREEKRKAFMESLSPEQIELLKEQNRERGQQKNNEGLDSKDQQKQQIREQIRENGGKGSMEQQKQQMQENKNNNPGSGGGSGNGSGTQTGK